MSATKDNGSSAMQHRINAEIQDNLDRTLELELEDSDLADLLAEEHELPEGRARLSAQALFHRAPAPSAGANQVSGVGLAQQDSRSWSCLRAATRQARAE